jgi:NAD(P)-dependent dehydrogenase (short-subunit alcohol dehydrogenase family)
MIKDKPVALVTGAGQGIGRGISIELAKNGFDIVGVVSEKSELKGRK